jgi:diketogulonate reductase-like aldo/keto reductase
MKFNHLLNERERLQFCKNRNLVVCKWKPVSEGQVTAGNNVCVSMLCEECGARTEKFLHSEDYKTHEKLILSEVNDV